MLSASRRKAWYTEAYALRLDTSWAPIEYIGNPMVPAPLLGKLRILLTEGRPQPQVPIGNRAPRGFEPVLAQIAQHYPPGLLGLALTALYR
jgi:hypothetical protein